MGALTGIKVIDLTRILAGPFCSMMLADMGADVIKVESPNGGDPIRGQGAFKYGVSWYFAQFNRNKRSIILDLRSEQGKAVLADLIRQADVLVENYRPGVLDAMGFDQRRLDALNPALVVTRITGYGSTGPYNDRPSFDFIAQAMSGFMSTTGLPDGDPMRGAPPLSDLIAGLYAAFGTASALIARGGVASAQPPGRGQVVETALTNSLISFLAYLSAEYFATGQNPARTGNDHPITAPYGLFEAADGQIAVAPSQPYNVTQFLGALGLSDLLTQDDFRDNQARLTNRAALNALINAETCKQSVDHWIDVINEAGCPCGRVMSLGEVFDDPQVQAQDMAIDIDHPGHGPVRVTGFPVKMTGTPCEVRFPAPNLGAHGAEILQELGYSAEKITATLSAATPKN
ncbi:MAG: CoA transferase [Rhodospirillaceae bacterium]